MCNDLEKVIEHVSEYFNLHLPQYTILEIRRKSYHIDDSYLYMVSAKKDDGTYAVWTNWNEDLKTLNHGYYDLSSAEDCIKIFAEHYHKGFFSKDADFDHVICHSPDCSEHRTHTE